MFNHSRLAIVFCLSFLTSACFTLAPCAVLSAVERSNTEIAQQPPLKQSVQLQAFGDWFYRCVAAAPQGDIPQHNTFQALPPNNNASSANKQRKPAKQQCEIVQLQQVQQGAQAATVLTVALALQPLAKKHQKVIGSATHPQLGQGRSPSVPKEGAPRHHKDSKNVVMTSVAPLNVLLPAALRYSVDGKTMSTTPYQNCTSAGCWAVQQLDQKALYALKKGREGVGHFRLADGRNVHIQFSLKGFSAAFAALEKGAA